MQDLNAFLAEDPVEVEILDVQHASDLTRTVVVDTRSAHAVTAVGDVELVAIAPGPALVEFLALIVDVAVSQFALDQRRDRAAGDEVGQDLDRKAQRRGHVEHVGFSTGHLHVVVACRVHGLTVERGDPDPHAARNHERIATILFKLDSHIQYLSFLVAIWHS